MASYRLDIHHSLTDNVRRIMGAQIDKALTELSTPNPRVTTIHETRKCLKRIRALLKLVRPGLDPKVYRNENNRFRNIAKALSHARDLDVLKHTLLILTTTSDDDAKTSLDLVRKNVEKTHKTMAAITDTAVAETKQALADAKRLYQQFEFEDDTFAALQKGLEKCYGEARSAQRKAFLTAKDEDFHDWRKPVQLHWRQMSLFLDAWPDLFRARLELARTLSQHLGDDHDLAVLSAFVQTRVASGDLSQDVARTLEILTKRHQLRLREVASPLGQMLFQQSAKAHANYVFSIWQISKNMPGSHASHS